MNRLELEKRFYNITSEINNEECYQNIKEYIHDIITAERTSDITAKDEVDNTLNLSTYKDLEKYTPITISCDNKTNSICLKLDYYKDGLEKGIVTETKKIYITCFSGAFSKFFIIEGMDMKYKNFGVAIKQSVDILLDEYI